MAYKDRSHAFVCFLLLIHSPPGISSWTEPRPKGVLVYSTEPSIVPGWGVSRDFTGTAVPGTGTSQPALQCALYNIVPGCVSRDFTGTTPGTGTMSPVTAVFLCTKICTGIDF